MMAKTFVRQSLFFESWNERSSPAAGGRWQVAGRRGPAGRKKYTAHGLVRRGRPLTSQTAFGGQLPYKGSLVQPAREISS